MDSSAVLEQFTFEKSEFNNEVFIMGKEDREVYTYLDNGKGLQTHHPYLTKTLTPITVLDDDQLGKLQETAAKFSREEEEGQERTFVLQIVSSFVNGPNTNFHQMVLNPKHPYLRVVIGKDNPDLGTKKGEVYEVGYGWERKPLVPLVLSTGRFRSPDIWEYMPCEERVVTNIPISQKEAHDIFVFTNRYHKEHINLGKKIGFHLGGQNCSVYVRQAARQAGIDLPTEVKVTDFLRSVCPSWIQAVGDGIRAARKAVDNGVLKLGQLFPRWIRDPLAKGRLAIKQAVKKTSELAIASFLNPLRIVLGDGFGRKGRKFSEEEETISPSMWKPRNYFTIPNINLPGVLQKWQRDQASTEIFKQPRQFAVVTTDS